MDGYGRTRMHDNIVPWALRALGTKIYDLHGIPGLFLVAKKVFRVGYLSTLSALLLESEASFFGTAYAPNKNN